MQCSGEGEGQVVYTMHSPLGISHQITQAPKCVFFIHVHQEQCRYLRHPLAVAYKQGNIDKSFVMVKPNERISFQK